ncbi:protein DNA-DAMAGE INDUCIBLE 1-like [Solanum pennellii]|uniref:Protein DNA-DAMAGE INDUCIBLE 1-like n=1 Tax=Solanum pennellii TaxID=28526 RepID=A0ABM1UYG3_SOLPN|nr:protein DNA-DAMAGE INDUCIBLE 1-like [Solanum pennellii]
MKKTQVAKGDGCYICGGPHVYAKCSELKNLGAILRERKEKEAQEEDEVEETKQLGLISLCGAVTKQPPKLPRQEKPRQEEQKHAEQGPAKSKACSQYVDIKINGKCARALVDTGAEVNLMAKTAATRLGLQYSPSNAQIKTVNAPPTPVDGVAHGVSITIGNWQGKTKFTVAPLDIFDTILGQEFFQQCHAVIDPYLQRLMIMEKGGTCMVPMVKAQKTEGQIRLTAVKLERVDERKKKTSTATIASLGEDNGAEKSLPPRSKKVPRRNTAVMKEKPPRQLPPMKEEVRKIGSREIGQPMRRLLEGIDRVR